MQIVKLITLSSFLVLTGCISLAPEYQRPDFPVPQQFSPAQNPPGSNGSYEVPGWQQFFTDPASAALIEQTLSSNADVKMAALTVREAAANRGLTQADRSVQINGNLSASSEGGFTGDRRTADNYDAGLSLSLDPDFWGRLRNLSESAQENVLAAQEAQRMVQIALISTVMQSYYRYQLAAEQADISRESLENYTRAYQFTERSLMTGKGNVLALEQAQGQTESAAADIAARNGELKQAAVALQRITGDYRPPAVSAVLSSPAVVLPANLSSGILLQRPDIREAEHLLIAANADIGAARAAFFPSVSLTGDITGSSSNLSSVLDSASGIWRFIPKITIPLFNGERNKTNLTLAEIRREKAVVVYEQRIQNAFKEVADALAARESLTQEISAQRRYARSLEKTVQRAQFLFANGQSSYLNVLDAQRTLLTTRQTLVTLEFNRKINEITLFAALGGGWKE